MNVATKRIGRLHFEVWNEDGTFDRAWDCFNADTIIGLNHALNVEFGAVSQIAAWFCGLIDNVGFSSVSTGDTAGSHAGWNESTAYSESVRQTWSPGAASGGSITNASPMVFTCNANGTVIAGAFLASVSTKNSTSGTLSFTGTFTPQTLQSGQQLRVTFTKALVSSS